MIVGGFIYYAGKAMESAMTVPAPSFSIPKSIPKIDEKEMEEFWGEA